MQLNLIFYRTFEVICVENNIGKNGHEMAKKLAEAKIKTTLIPDTAIYAVMHRVHKAFVSKLLSNQMEMLSKYNFWEGARNIFVEKLDEI